MVGTNVDAQVHLKLLLVLDVDYAEIDICRRERIASGVDAGAQHNNRLAHRT